jgi:hypothetical protein
MVVVRGREGMADEQHTGIILTSEVCVRGEHSGESCNGRRQMSGRPVERTLSYIIQVGLPGRPVERTGEPERTSYTTYTSTEL